MLLTCANGSGCQSSPLKDSPITIPIMTRLHYPQGNTALGWVGFGIGIIQREEGREGENFSQVTGLQLEYLVSEKGPNGG